ncbi:MAG: sulfotransferase domain-containing protein, partial [Gammaproteobacteria bacterium]|nr:sulfotransferase domain-containing protein [Gammaproteobacteria bacterium]
FYNALSVVNCRRKDLLQFIEEVRDTDDLSQVPLHYFEHLQRQCKPGVPIVFKAADQIMCLEKLQQCSPRSKKIVIIRDGRDAAISALHFNKLMTQWDAPWRPQQISFHDRLRAWSTRAAALAHHCRKHDILVLRYEDLQRDFHGVCASLFQRLGLARSPQLLEQIHQQTNFSAVTGGREPGESAEAVVRKGVIGEWKSTLGEEDATLAWKTAQGELRRFG